MEVADCATMRPAPADPNVTAVALPKPPPTIVMAPGAADRPRVGTDGGHRRAPLARPAAPGVRFWSTGVPRPLAASKPVPAANCPELRVGEVVVALRDVGEGAAVRLLRCIERGADTAERAEAALIGVDEEPGVGGRGDAGAAEARPVALPVGGHAAGRGVRRIREVRHRPARGEPARASCRARPPPAVPGWPATRWSSPRRRRPRLELRGAPGRLALAVVPDRLRRS